MFPIDRYEYELSDYNLHFEWTTYEEERRYHIRTSTHTYMLCNTSYVHEPTGAIRIREDHTRNKGLYRAVIGVLVSKEVDEKGLPKYRRLAEMIVRDTSEENVRAVLAQEGLLTERWTYEGAWSWGWSSLPTRGRRRFLNFLENRGSTVGYWVKGCLDKVFDGVGYIIYLLFVKKDGDGGFH
jgi:hypothetical protein